MSASRSSSPSRDDLGEISQISKQLTQARKELLKQGRVAKEATEALGQRDEACAQLKTALAESKCKEEDAADKLIDAEESISELKRLVTKLEDQSATSKVDSALVKDLQAKLKHSEEERQKFKEQATHELRKTREELKKANEKLEAARMSTTSIESLLPSRLHALVKDVLTAKLTKYLTRDESPLLDAIKGLITDVFSKAPSRTLPRQPSPNKQSQPLTDVLVESEPGDVRLKVDRVTSSTPASACSASPFIAEPQPNKQILDTVKEVMDANTSYQDFNSGSQCVKAGDLDSSTDLEIQNPRFERLPGWSGENARQVQTSAFPGPTKMQIPPKHFTTLPAATKQEKTNVSAPQAKSSSEKSTPSASTTLKAPIETESRPWFIRGGNIEALFGWDPKSTPITPISTLPATAMRDKTNVSAPQGKSSSEKSKPSAATVVEPPIGTESDPFFVPAGQNFSKLFRWDPKQTPITPDVRSSEVPKASAKEEPAQLEADNSQIGASIVRSEKEDTKRPGSPLLQPVGKWQRRE